MEQSIKVFQDSFHSSYIFGLKNVKINVLGEKLAFSALLSN